MIKLVKKLISIFKKKPSTEDVVCSSRNAMDASTRAIEKDIESLELEEKKILEELEEAARTGKEATQRILAQELGGVRRNISLLQGRRSQIRGLSSHTQALFASSSLSSGMKSANKAMCAMKEVMDPGSVKEFQNNSTKL